MGKWLTLECVLYTGNAPPIIPVKSPVRNCHGPHGSISDGLHAYAVPIAPQPGKARKMGKNILVLTGSPRKNGNSETLAASFIKGAESKGHAVTVFNAAAKIVQGCRACNACWSKGEACVFDDGFRDLAPLLAEADALVIVSPLYWFTFTAQIKAALDKFYSFMVPASPQPLKLKESVLLMTAEDTRPEAYTGAVGSYKEICNYLELADRGIITVLGVNKVGDIAGNKALAEAERLGASL